MIESTFTKEFKEYRMVHDFMHPADPLKKWINGSNYINHYQIHWDELMPVIEKIHNLGICDGDEGSHLIDNVDEDLLRTDISETYSRVLEFLNWYTTQK